MRLLRVGPAGHERPAVLGPVGEVLDLSGVTPDIGPAFLADDGIGRVRAALDAGGLPEIREPGRTGPPLARPGKIVCIGLNYSDHAAETGAATPAEPVVFMKDPSTAVGPDDQVLVPRGRRPSCPGTPAGVALGQPDPKPYLRPGDVVELEIDGLGRQCQKLGAA